MYMTNEEAQEYRHLLDRKKKALSLDRKEREKYPEEWEKIVEGTDKKVLDYVYFVGLQSIKWTQFIKKSAEYSCLVLCPVPFFFFIWCHHSERTMRPLGIIESFDVFEHR